MKLELRSVVLIAASAGLALTTNAATISASTTAPTVDGNDIANLVASTGAQKWFNDVEHDAGQTFIPAADGMVNSITIWLSQGNPNDGGNESVDLRLGTVTRPGGTFTFTDTYVENASLGASPGGDWAAGDYVTFTFDTPQAVTAGVEYGIITDAQSMGAWQQGIPYRHRSGNNYANGALINRGSESANTDLIFHLDIDAAAAIPEPSTGLLGIAGLLFLARRRRA